MDHEDRRSLRFPNGDGEMRTSQAAFFLSDLGQPRGRRVLSGRRRSKPLPATLFCPAVSADLRGHEPI